MKGNVLLVGKRSAFQSIYKIIEELHFRIQIIEPDKASVGMVMTYQPSCVIFDESNAVQSFQKLINSIHELSIPIIPRLIVCFQKITVHKKEEYFSLGVDDIVCVDHPIEVLRDFFESQLLKAEKVLHDKTWYRAIDQVSDGIFIVDKEGTIQQTNKWMEQILKKPSNEFIGKKCYELIHGQECRIDNCPYLVSEQTLKRENIEVEVEEQWYKLTIDPIMDYQGHITGAIHFISNITQQKKTELSLKRSEFNLKRAQKITHIGNWFLDIKTNEVIWTEELYRMYDFNPELPPPPYTEHMKLFTPESWELLSNSLAKTTNEGIPYELELKTVKKRWK